MSSQRTHCLFNAIVIIFHGALDVNLGPPIVLSSAPIIFPNMRYHPLSSFLVCLVILPSVMCH
jgi:hypothetical protein